MNLYTHNPINHKDRYNKEIHEGDMLRVCCDKWCDDSNRFEKLEIIMTCKYSESMGDWVFNYSKPFKGTDIWEEIQDCKITIVGRDGLLFCPFCGHEAIKISRPGNSYNPDGRSGEDKFWITCNGCNYHHRVCTTSQEATDAWNMRF